MRLKRSFVGSSNKASSAQATPLRCSASRKETMKRHMIQIRHSDLHRRLKVRAAETGETVTALTEAALVAFLSDRIAKPVKVVAEPAPKGAAGAAPTFGISKAFSTR